MTRGAANRAAPGREAEEAAGGDSRKIGSIGVHVNRAVTTHGFAVNVANAQDGLHVLDRLRPDVFKLDARELHDTENLLALLRRSAAADVAVLFKRVETPQTLTMLRQLADAANVPLLAQGYLLDEPRASLLQPEPVAAAA